MSDAVTRLNAALEGRYAIERELGEGGMATVYLADDLKHQRKVALKVLKPELAAVVGAERFLAEITTTANLTHPHILPLFDSGEADSFLFYVMPHIEGESLRERIDREKQLGVNESVAITQKVAGALDYAHGNGVVHRDIKPGNILLSAQGEPLVADFGIALAVAQAGAGRITETGLSLGTPHYMSPEQATGDRDVDPRSDVYALGCVLYEMLSGQPPFSASSAQAVLVKILTMDAPSITSERRTVPPNVAAALAQALEKLPADRFTSAAELAAALADESFTYQARTRSSTAPAPSEPIVPVATAEAWHRDGRSVAALVVAAITSALAAWGWLGSPPMPEPGVATRALIDLGEITLAAQDEIVVSPDGSQFAVAGFVEGQRALFLRGAGDENFRLLADTEGALEPSFSPDGQWISYGTGSAGALWRVSVSGGAPRAVVPSASGLNIRDTHWGDDGTIVFSGPSGLYLVRDTGGDPDLLISREELVGWYNPSLLPGGRGVIGTWNNDIVLFDIEADSIRELIAGGYDPEYVETGHLLYLDTSGGLWAVAFHAGRGDVTGEPFPILEGVTGDGTFARYSVSRNGTLVYGTGGVAGGGEQLLMLDLEGNGEPLILTPRDLDNVKWSPDGQSVAYQSVAEDDTDDDIYTYNVELGTTPRQLTFEGQNLFPVFSPDGNRVAFMSLREGTDGFDLFVKTLDDDVPARSLITLPISQVPTQWPSDTLIVFEQTAGAVAAADLWMLDLSDPDNAVAVEYLSSEANLRDIVVSPDGTLAAYTSNETGRAEVYVRSFPEPGGQVRVSEAGGEFPMWSPDGDTVYYWALPGAGGAGAGIDVFMAASIERDPTPVVLSRASLFQGNFDRTDTDLHPDGDRLVVTQAAGVSATAVDAGDEPERFIVVVNWFEELRERMGN